MPEYQTKYWQRSGKTNTSDTLKLVLKAAQAEKVRHVVIASTTGATVKAFLKSDPRGIKVICVSHHTGFAKPGVSELDAKTERYLRKHGVEVYQATHFFGGMGRAIRLKFGGLYPDEIAAQVLRIFGQGVKVAVEIAIMTLDAGLIPYGEKVIAVGGTDQGADAALLILPAHGKQFFDTKVLKIICKPQA